MPLHKEIWDDPTVTKDSETHWVTAVDGARLFVLDKGEGEPVLFIPGLGYASWSWSRQIGPISQVARVLAVDNRGVGHSDKPAGPYSIDQLAEDAYGVLVEREALPAHVVGASMGGYIALTLALRHPEAVRSLFLVATTSGGPGSHAVPEETLQVWAEAARLAPEEFARETMPMSFAPGWVEDHPVEFAELLALRLSAPTPTDAWVSQFKAAAAFLHEGLAPGAVFQPAMIVHGTDDRVVPYENAAHLVTRLPHASLVTLPGAGHLCWIERASEVNDLIKDLLARSVPGVRKRLSNG